VSNHALLLLVFILLDLPLARSFVFPLALRLTLGLVLCAALVLAAARWWTVILRAAALWSSLRRPGWRAPGLGALGLRRRCIGADPILRGILMTLHLRRGLRGTPLRLRRGLRRTPLPLRRLLLLLLM
jgi:hypothetical protein